MKKILSIIGVVISLILIIISIYTLIKINFVFSVKDGKMYDGFGFQYRNNEPSSPYSIVAYIELIGGISLLGYSKKCIKVDKGV